MFLNSLDYYKRIKQASVRINPYSLSVVLISLFISILWFRKKMMLATAEEGIPFYDLTRTFDLYNSYFYNTGLGISGVFNIPRSFLFGFLSVLQRIGFAGWQIQASIYFILILVPLIFLKRLFEETFPGAKKIVGFIASLFYVFNLFTLSQVWTRFTLSLIFLWSYLPLFLYLWVAYLKEFRLKYLILLLVTTFLYSASFVIFSPVIVLWISAAIYTFYELFSRKDKFNISIYSTLAFLLWVISNLWWIYPFYQAQYSEVVAKTSVIQNFESLQDVSKYFPNSQIFLLKQKYMFGENSPYFYLYKSNIRTLISIVFLYLTTVGIFASRRQNKYLFLVVLFATSWFLIKGTNPPMGDRFFDFAFTHVSVLQVFRNSYEKLGTLFLLPYSIFFAFGISKITSIFRNIKILLTIYVSVFFALGYLCLPFITGSLFKNTSYIQVPTYYKAANDLIENQDGGDSRILQLPFLRGSSVKEDWNYVGEEPSEFLFRKASVSRIHSVPNLDEFYYKLGEPTYYWKNPNYSKILSVMKVKYIVLHKDVELGSYHQEKVDDTRRILEAMNGIQPIVSVDKLELFENKLTSDGRLYIADNTFFVENLDGMFGMILSSKFDQNTDVIVTFPMNKIDKFEKLAIPKNIITKISDVTYKLNVENVNQPFILVLANNYDSNWKATISGDRVIEHFEVNGFANGWLIDKIGSYEISVDYDVWPW